MRKLSPAVVVTMGAATLACTPKNTLPPNPPSVQPSPTGTQAPQPSATPVPAALPSPPASTQPKSGSANPTTADGRTIHLAYNDDGCFFYQDFPPLKPGEMRPPGTAPPSKRIDCPPIMKDPAFQTCRGGDVRFKGEGCECFEPGNPPRVRPNECPDVP